MKRKSKVIIIFLIYYFVFAISGIIFRGKVNFIWLMLLYHLICLLVLILYKYKVLKKIVFILLWTGSFLCFIFSTFFIIMKLYGTSMEPSILDESILFVWQQDFEISREDILVIEFPERWQDDFKLGFKRVIGMPGDSFYFVDDKVYINGKEYWYWWAAKGEIMKGIENDRIKEDYYFILGDNFNSLDSRYIGLIHRSKVYGKVMFVLIEGKEPKSSLENDH